MTVVTALKDIRIARARELLMDTELSVAEVARNVGYEDENYFGRVFRQEVGVSPRHYRCS